MSYSLIIPPELVAELYHVRGKTGKSIRKQILEAIRRAINDFKQFENQSSRAFTSGDILIRTNGGEKNGTA